MPLDHGRMKGFVAALLAEEGGLVETVEPDGLEVLTTPSMQHALGVGEFCRLGFGATMPENAVRVGIESDWLHRFERVLGPRLLTAYWAFADTDRRRLLALSWQDATQMILDDLRAVHPDLAERLRQVDMVRHGHAMAIPTPGQRSSAALAAIPDSAARVSFAHADLSAYSVFEEAFTRGDAAGRRAARRLGRPVSSA